MKITFDITYNSYYKHWVVWKNIEKEKSTNFVPLFKGTRKECQKWLKEYKNGQRTIQKKDIRTTNI